MQRKYNTVEERREANRLAVERHRAKKTFKQLETRGRDVLTDAGVPPLAAELVRKAIEDRMD